MSSARVRHLALICGCSAVLGVLALGCGAKPDNTAPRKVVTDFNPARATPAELVASTVQLLRWQLDAIGRHDAKTRELCQDKLLALCATELMYARARMELGVLKPEPTVELERKRRSVADLAARTWGPLIAYYRDGIALDKADVLTSADGLAAAVYVPMKAADSNVTLRVDCVRSADQWSLLRLEPFAANTPHTAPSDVAAPTVVPTSGAAPGIVPSPAPAGALMNPPVNPATATPTTAPAGH